MATTQEQKKIPCCTCKAQFSCEMIKVCSAKPRKDGSKGEDTFRCKPCHNTFGVLNRTWDLRPDLHSVYKDEFNKKDKSAFIAKAHNCAGAELPAFIETTIRERELATRSSSFAAVSHWLDEEDLRDEFKKKQKQLDNILKNGARFFCPIRECELIGVPKYEGIDLDKTEKFDERTLDVSTTEKRKRVKPEGESKLKKPKVETESDCKLSRSELKQLQGAKSKLDAEIDVMKVLIEECKTEPVKPFISVDALNVYAKYASEGDVLSNELDLFAISGNPGEAVAEEVEKVKAKTIDLKTKKQQLRKLLSTGKELAGVPDEPAVVPAPKKGAVQPKKKAAITLKK